VPGSGRGAQKRSSSGEGVGLIRRSSIARNSFWFGLESAIDSFVALVVSVIVARVIGPERMGHFVYIGFLVNLASRLGGCGPGATTRKYLAEHIGRGERGLARHVFFTMLRMHVELGVAFALIGSGLTLAFGDPAHRIVAYLLVGSLAASVINIVPSQTNMAAEDFARNVPASLISLACYVAVVALSLTLGWGLVGLASAVLIRRILEMLMRLFPALKWARSLPHERVAGHMAKKLMSFSGKGLAVALLLLVVWDRSELVLLKQFSAIQEVTFYSVAFGLGEAVLVLPNVFGSAISARLMAEHGKTGSNVGPLSSASIRYLALLIFPVCVGLAALSGPLVRVGYGQSYIPAIPVLIITLLLSIPKAFYWLPSAMLQAADRQGVMFGCLFAIAIVNISLDFALIPRFGAMGAAIGNGVSQTSAVLILMVVTGRICKIRLPWMALLRNLCVALVMGGAVFFAVAPLPALAALVTGPVVGAIVYLVLVRATNLFSPEDVASLTAFTAKIPARFRRHFMYLLDWIAGAPGATAGPGVDLALPRPGAARL
jgi:O-antigen/teichoic acid export membrane protein